MGVRINTPVLAMSAARYAGMNDKNVSIQLKDMASGEVIRQIPGESAVRMAKALREAATAAAAAPSAAPVAPGGAAAGVGRGHLMDAVA